jgi:hypothetical protein
LKTQIEGLLKATILFKSSYERIRASEEKYNIFSVLYKDHNERKLHSRFISSLLNPKGSHGYGNIFLNLFIGQVESLNIDDYSRAIVYPEEETKKEFKNIDILIIDRYSRHAVIIENKFFASDSNNEEGGQLERYFKIIRDEEKILSKNIKTLYLTLDGHFPSQESLGEFKDFENINGKCVSYDKLITEWLNKCKMIVPSHPFIRESIFQYENLIEKMTNNQTTIEERVELKDLIGANQNYLDAAKYLFDNFKHIKWHAIADFWDELENEIQKVGFEIIESVNKDSIYYLTHNQSNSKSEEGGLIFKTSDGLKIYIWHEPYCDLWWGPLKSENKDVTDLLNNLKDKNHFQNNEYTLHRYIELKNGKRLSLKDFTQENTFKLISRGYRAEIISEIVSDISNTLNR